MLREGFVMFDSFGVEVAEMSEVGDVSGVFFLWFLFVEGVNPIVES